MKNGRKGSQYYNQFQSKTVLTIAFCYYISQNISYLFKEITV